MAYPLFSRRGMVKQEIRNIVLFVDTYYAVKASNYFSFKILLICSWFALYLLKKEQECIIRFQNSRRSREF